MREPLDIEEASAARHPFELVVERLRLLGGVVSFTSDVQVRATCPAHADGRPSLAVKRCEDRVLLKCHGGCSLSSILGSLGLRKADLFVGERSSSVRRQVVDVYEYLDNAGTLVARKKRSTTKQFWWERPDPTARGGWRSGLGGLGLPGLYRRSELTGASRVFVVEGEKAADRLRSLGLVATCGPAGAGTWRTAWSEALLAGAPAGEFVVLADNDRAGRLHAERVAADLTAVHAQQGPGELRLKVVALPALPPGGDVVDWLEAGHARQHLLDIVAVAPSWSPEAVAQRQVERRREQAKLRMQRHRARLRGTEAPRPTPLVDGDAMALAAVISLLESGQQRSARAVKKALVGTVPRAAIERALQRGVQAGVLATEPTGLCRAISYRVCSDIRGVTVAGTPCAGVRAPHGTPTLDVARIEGPETVSQCDVTPFAVTQCERASIPLQETLPNSRHTSVTNVGTPAGHAGQSQTEILNRFDVLRPTALAGSDTAESSGGIEGQPSVPTEQVGAVESGACCGRAGAELRCKLCQWSPTYDPWLRERREQRGASDPAKQPLLFSGSWA